MRNGSTEIVKLAKNDGWIAKLIKKEDKTKYSQPCGAVAERSSDTALGVRVCHLLALPNSKHSALKTTALADPNP